MRFSIDTVFLTEAGLVVRAVSKIGPFVLHVRCSEASHVLELPAGIIEKTGIAIGDVVEFE